MNIKIYKLQDKTLIVFDINHVYIAKNWEDHFHFDVSLY